MTVSSMFNKIHISVKHSFAFNPQATVQYSPQDFTKTKGWLLLNPEWSVGLQGGSGVVQRLLSAISTIKFVYKPCCCFC